MHRNEGRINSRANITFRKITNYANSGKKSARLIPVNQKIWNAGVLGFKASDRKLLEIALKITDKIYNEFPKHIVEQLAISIVFDNLENRNLLPAEKYIFHYWNFKEFRMVLKLFFDKHKDFENIYTRYKNISPIELIKPKMDYSNSGFVLKNLKKMFGKWKFPDYQI